MYRLIIISIFSLLIVLTVSCDTNFVSPDNSNKPLTSTFYLYYGFSGLGSNMGSFQPTIRIKEANFIYTYEQNSYYDKKSDRIDTVCIKLFRQSSIDSIIDIIKDLKDTLIREYNYCIMSGGIHSLTIANGTDTTNFYLSNTFNYTALKVAHILNEYAPVDKQLWVNEQMIKDAEDCSNSLLKREEKVRKARSKKNGT